MAFDYGSIDLGLKNPFKKEGTITAIRGAAEIAMGVFLLFKAAAIVKENAGIGWILVLFGLFLLASGIRFCASGIIATLRFFVGRNHPTSLAQNFSHSEASTAKEEYNHLAYTRQGLTEMLVGRKNSTFVEPEGLVARFMHSVFPKLTFMPYPVRNMAQHLFGAWVRTVVALIAYALTAFVSLAGFAGDIGEFAFPAYSMALTLYLMLVWRSAGKDINRTADKRISSLGGKELTKVIASAILLTVIVGLALSFTLKTSGLSVLKLEETLAWLPAPHTGFYLLGITIAAVIASILCSLMLKKRLGHCDPKAEVSELRENWQESVHPNEIFINLDNLVMANRRYKEVPNRVYQELEPNLEEQVEGKGKFFGEMIQEVQPKFKALDLGPAFNSSRMLSLICGNIGFLIASILTVLLAFNVGDLYNYINEIGFKRLGSALDDQQIAELSSLAASVIHVFLAAVFVRAFARILSNAAHVFFAEMQFESHLIYVKVEGTFTESKISTGTSIHDSTRSENTLVRSSITPWVIVSRIVSSTFAASGMRNLEHPRYILEMHKNDQELASIRHDVIGFLKDRESIAAITSERDLHNASQIHDINQQSRAIPMQNQANLIQQDEEAAGYLRQEQNLTDTNKD